MDHIQRFGLALPPKTEAASIEFIEAVLDPQIDELQNQLALLQGVRRAIASIFGIDRRGDDVGKFGQGADAANRQHYEGEGGADAGDGRMKPAGRIVPRSAA
ncbi:hypothetical protein NKJ87_19770 [Mesorhizobium sp. M0027]|uniref:hypothetical protein n=1 Tax=Mesorhizobium sp. M0027 TaxID=2956848 RepID=UPI003337540B